MEETCSVLGCPVRTYGRSKERMFFRFPLNPERRNLWVKAMQRQNLTPDTNSFICSDHFEESYVIRNPEDSKIVSITENAVPTKFKICRRIWKSDSVSSSSSTLSGDECSERSESPECRNLEMLSKVCCLVKPLEVQNNPTGESQNLAKTLEGRLQVMESNLKVCEDKLKMYKRKVEELKRFKNQTATIGNPQNKSNEHSAEKNLDDDFVEILRSLASEHVQNLKDEIDKRLNKN